MRLLTTFTSRGPDRKVIDLVGRGCDIRRYARWSDRRHVSSTRRRIVHAIQPATQLAACDFLRAVGGWPAADDPEPIGCCATSSSPPVTATRQSASGIDCPVAHNGERHVANVPPPRRVRGVAPALTSAAAASSCTSSAEITSPPAAIARATS